MYSINYRSKFIIYFILDSKKSIDSLCTAPQKLDMKNLTFGVFFNEINL